MIKQWIQRRRERLEKRREERRVEKEKADQELAERFQSRAKELGEIITKSTMISLGWVNRNRSDQYVEIYALLGLEMFSCQLTLKGALYIKRVGGDR